MGRRRRSWSLEEKRSICRETLVPGVSVAQVARRHGLNANQVFNWLRDPRFAPGVADGPVFLPVEVSPAVASVSAACCEELPARVRLEVAGGHRVVAEGGFDPERLGRVLKAWLS